MITISFYELDQEFTLKSPEGYQYNQDESTYNFKYDNTWNKKYFLVQHETDSFFQVEKYVSKGYKFTFSGKAWLIFGRISKKHSNANDLVILFYILK